MPPSTESGECVKVVVRIRPLSRKEIQDGHEACTIADEERGIITVSNPKGDEGDPAKTFTFDAVFSPEISQRKLYDTCSAPVVEEVLKGFNATIFAYGQTGSGKTFTMEGVQDEPELRGIIPNAFQQIFDKVGLAEATQQFLVRASYLEIYNEEIRDLLAKETKTKLELKENADSGVYVKDLTSFLVKSSHEIDQVMQAGKKNRSVGATLMNQGSSRSHAIFTIIVECCQSDQIRGEHITVGKLNLVDLAGSERQAKTGATGDRLKEATKINLSLSALGNVISALVDGKSTHIPYRDSKLTRLLQDSLGGNTKTVMCANCGPAGYNYDETVSTLRYANRAKNIKNKPKINEDPKDAMLREFQEEILRLKNQLAAGGGGPASPYSGGGSTEWAEGPLVYEEKIIEQTKVKEEIIGVSSAQLEKTRREAQEKKEKIRQDAEAKLRDKLEAKENKDKEKKYQDELERKEQELKREKEKKKQLVSRIKAMQNKLLVGGDLLTKAEKQQAELRAAEQALREKEAYQRNLTQELAAREDLKIDLAERFSSIDEEVEKKTRKLEKLIKKLSVAEKELADLSTEFQREREDLLDTIRQLAKQIKLKEHIADHFIPREKFNALVARTVWNQDADTWTLKPIQLDPSLKRRPLSIPNLRRPQTEFARSRKQHDPNPRYKDENIIVLELETTDRMTQDYTGPDMHSNVEHLLVTPIDQDDPQCHPLAIVPTNHPSAEGGAPSKHAQAKDPSSSAEMENRRTVRTPSRSGTSRTSNRPSTANRSRRS